MTTKINDVVMDIVDHIGKALAKHDVTLEQYRKGIGFIAKVQEAKEVPLLVDVFLNHIIVDIEERGARNSRQTIQGPYFLDAAPDVTNQLLTLPEDKGTPLIVRGRVVDERGRPAAGALMNIWHSTPDGRYSGFHGIERKDLYRGKLRTDADGRYQVATTLPVPYHIPDKGPVGELLKMMGKHSWRPAHVHFKITNDGCRPLTTQAYFEGGAWVDSDSCSGVHPALIYRLGKEGDAEVLEVNFILQDAAAAAMSPA